MFDLLKDVCLDNSKPIGCVIISGDNTSLYTIRGKEIVLHSSRDVNLPNSHSRGGQSQKRFERLIKEKKHNYITKVIEDVLKTFTLNIPIVVGGPSDLKFSFSDRLEKISKSPQILKIINTQYGRRNGLNELISQCTEILKSLDLNTQKNAVADFFKSLHTDDGLSVYGIKNINKCIKNGLLKTLIISSSKLDFIDQFIIPTSTNVVELSEVLPESSQILKGFGGIVGLSHYPLQIDDSDSEDI